MTDEEWLTCGSPSRMRGEIRARSFRAVRWVLFDLACIDRVRDLLGPHARRYLDAVAEMDDALLPAIGTSAARRDAVRDDAASLRDKADPLRDAKSAAARAVMSLGSFKLAVSNMVCVAAGRRVGQPGLPDAVVAEQRVHAALMRCVFRSTLSPVAFSAAWRTDTAVAITSQMRVLRDYSAMPILADALQDAGCDDERVLAHCRCNEPHVRGCWVVDHVLEAAGVE